MADMLLFGCLADARRARPRCFRLFSAHLDEYLSEKDVKSRFRFGRDSLNYLADLLSDDLARNTARNHALSPLVQVLVALRFFALGSFLEVIGDTFGLPKSTVSRCITHRLCVSLYFFPRTIFSSSSRLIRYTDKCMESSKHDWTLSVTATSLQFCF